MTNADMLRVGIVGAGTIVQNAHLPVLCNQRDVTLAWITDRSPDRARSVGQAFGVTSLPSHGALDADLVLLAIPLEGREAWLARFAAASVAVLVEKPFATTLAEHDRLAAPFAPERLAVGYQRRFHATSRFVKSAADHRWFGKLRRIVHHEGARATRAGPPGYADLPVARGGGLTVNLGCHGLDLAAWISSAEAIVLQSRQVEWDGDVDREARAEFLLETADGAVEFDFAISDLRSMDNWTTFRFDTAELRIDTAPSDEIAFAGCSTRLRASGGAANVPQAFHLQWRCMIDAVRTGAPSMLSAASARLASAAIEAITTR